MTERIVAGCCTTTNKSYCEGLTPGVVKRHVRTQLSAGNVMLQLAVSVQSFSVVVVVVVVVVVFVLLCDFIWQFEAQKKQKKQTPEMCSSSSLLCSWKDIMVCCSRGILSH